MSSGQAVKEDVDASNRVLACTKGFIADSLWFSGRPPDFSTSAMTTVLGRGLDRAYSGLSRSKENAWCDVEPVKD